MKENKGNEKHPLNSKKVFILKRKRGMMIRWTRMMVKNSEQRRSLIYEKERMEYTKELVLVLKPNTQTSHL